MGNLVANVGRPNVGKSTFVQPAHAKPSSHCQRRSGTTRDRQYGKVYWTGQGLIVDTGGWVVNLTTFSRKKSTSK